MSGVCGEKGIRHRPDSEGEQRETIAGLQYNTEYEVQVRSFRRIGEDLVDETGDTRDTSVTTKCAGTTP